MWGSSVLDGDLEGRISKRTLTILSQPLPQKKQAMVAVIVSANAYSQSRFSSHTCCVCIASRLSPTVLVSPVATHLLYDEDSW